MYDVLHKAKGLVSHGVSACAGCGLELIFRNVIDVLGEDTILVIPPGCSALFCGYGSEGAVRLPIFQGNLENTAAIAAGVRAALRYKCNGHTTVLGFAGDGATLDIGLQALSGVLERRDRILYICYDNEAYMNTGIQSSSSTSLGAYTTTTPEGKSTGSKDFMRIVMAHRAPYAASASVSDLPDLRRKVQKGKDAQGPAVLHIYTPCPTGWGSNPAKSIEIARLAVDTGAWVLYEYENGHVKINKKPKRLGELQEYFSLQSRFKRVTPDMATQMRRHCIEHYQEIAGMEGLLF